MQMKIKARVISADDKEIAPGALRMSSTNVPVRIIERIRPITVGVSSDLLDQVRKGKR